MRRRLLAAPTRPKRLMFVMTPLIDVMFLLLIFFMLSSQISPYSLIPIRRLATEGPPEAASAPAGAHAVAIRVARGFATIGGERIELGGMVPALAALAGKGLGGVNVVATRAATVQDIVTVLEAAQAAAIGNVTLVDAGGAP